MRRNRRVRQRTERLNREEEDGTSGPMIILARPGVYPYTPSSLTEPAHDMELKDGTMLKILSILEGVIVEVPNGIDITVEQADEVKMRCLHAFMEIGICPAFFKDFIYMRERVFKEGWDV